ncbi:hypothetical protein X560_2242 [Listeria fleischmannii 1991]|uniref:Uncharacterized protein n=1 Tax=Listeria fleischmannii 1991 TaxID=1430899 RepID=A0A0J8J265_9LIST|nr:hypothetical protein X560_2242 [Listeria fleischmannii 1991]
MISWKRIIGYWMSNYVFQSTAPSEALQNITEKLLLRFA